MTMKPSYLLSLKSPKKKIPCAKLPRNHAFSTHLFRHTDTCLTPWIMWTFLPKDLTGQCRVGQAFESRLRWLNSKLTVSLYTWCNDDHLLKENHCRTKKQWYKVNCKWIWHKKHQKTNRHHVWICFGTVKELLFCMTKGPSYIIVSEENYVDGFFGEQPWPWNIRDQSWQKPPEIGFPDLLSIRLDHVLKRTAQIKTPWQLRPCKSNMHWSYGRFPLNHQWFKGIRV